MKRNTNLKKRVLFLLMTIVISSAISFNYGQVPVKPASYEECEYFVGTMTFTVKALIGYNYQWYTAPPRSKIFTLIKGATTNVLTLTFDKLTRYTRELNGQQFRCELIPIKLGESQYSEIVYLYVLTKPTVTSQPSDATKYEGESVTFSISASGSTPRSYQWQLDKGSGYSNIEGATSYSYTIAAVNIGDAGAYRCVVINDCGTAYSSAATLNVLESIDGWFAQSSGTSKNLNQITALSKYNAWIVTAEKDQLLHTTDAGETWNTIYMVDAGALALNYYGYCIWFSSANNGYVGGYNGYAYTTNGGTTWAKMDVKTALALSDYFYTRDIYFYDTNIGWIVGDDGLIAYTSNGGTSWTKQNWGKDPVKVTDADLKCISFIDSQHGWIGGSNGVILITEDGGAHWVLQAAPETQSIVDIDFLSATKGFAVGGSYKDLYYTENAGTTWNKYNEYNLPYFYPNAIDFVDENNGWMAGAAYESSSWVGRIMRTNDGGNTWYIQTTENPDYLVHLAMIDQDFGWAIGWAGEIQRTANGGCLHPTMNLYEDIHLCANDPYTIIADTFKKNDNVFYSWSTGATTGRITVYETGTYSVIVTNLCGETAEDSKDVIFYPSPVAYAGEDVSICPGDTIQLIAEGGAHYQWTPGYSLSDNSIQNPRAFPTVTTTYTVTVTDTNNCTNADQVTVSVRWPYENEEICLVTVDPETEKNMVIWEKTPGVGISSYNIYRESSVAGVYNLVGNVPFDNLSVFVDQTSQPDVKSYKYKISVVDTCGNESMKSSYHKTMLLTSSLGPTSINLAWDEYEIEGTGFGFVKYRIYRGNTPDNMVKIDSISSDNFLYPDYNPPAGRNYYRIAGVISGVCDPANLLGKKADSGPYSHSMSNIEDNRLQVSINDLREDANNLRIYPNPFRNQTRITYTLDKPSDVRIEIYNLLGARTADIVNIKQDPGEFTYDINAEDMGVTEGVFYLRFTINGNTTVKKLILTK
jgi:photosystem II stability/assembly factor-like uncharacterized protein